MSAPATLDRPVRPSRAAPQPEPARSRRPRPGRLLRDVVFWLHLAVGVTTGLVVLIMSATGTALAFQRQILDWSAARHVVSAPAGAERLPLDTVVARARLALPADAQISSITVKSDADAPVTFGLSARRYAYADPYTGALLPANEGLQTFYFEMERWHRSLATGESLRGDPGVTITGACNLAFLFLIVTGAFLWLPRQRSWRAFRAVLLFERGLSGRRRDWNWHHVLGAWSAPVLFFLVLTGVFISYQWPTRWLERAFGEPAAAAAGGGGGGGGGRGGTASEGPVAFAIPLETVVARAAASTPGWASISVRMPASATAPIAATVSTSTAVRPDARTSLSFDVETGAMTRQPGYATLSTPRKLRAWVRGVHTGEALGAAGQAIAALACLAAVVLVWTGLALTWRRFLRTVRPQPKPA